MTIIDNAGRVVVPKALRDAADLRPGTRIRFRMADGRIHIEPEPPTVTLERRGAFVVAKAQGEEPPTLTTSEVAEVTDEVRARASATGW